MARTFLNGIAVNNQRITAMADPTGATDAATKQYVDNKILGLSWKQAVRVATTANGALATAYANGQVIDGQTLVTGDRILIKDQTTQSENGIYTVNASGAPTRATDADSSAELNGAAVTVLQGTTNADKAWTQTTDNPTVGTSNIVWAQFGGGSAYSAGNGISIVGSSISVNPASGGGISVAAGGVSVDHTKVPFIYSQSIGDGTTNPITVTHNLGTKDVHVQLYDNSTFDTLDTDVNRATVNTVSVTFPSAPTSNQYRIVIFG